jgi:hypothetical protein
LNGKIAEWKKLCWGLEDPHEWGRSSQLSKSFATSPALLRTLTDVIDGIEYLFRNAHSLCFDGSEFMLTWPCHVSLSRF